MKYLLLIRWDESAGMAWTPEQAGREMQAHGAFIQALGPRMLGGERLQPSSSARRMTVRGGRRQITEGPFTETHEALGGYYLIEAATTAEALDWAARCPSAAHGSVDVVPVWAT